VVDRGQRPLVLLDQLDGKAHPRRDSQHRTRVLRGRGRAPGARRGPICWRSRWTLRGISDPWSPVVGAVFRPGGLAVEAPATRVINEVGNATENVPGSRVVEKHVEGSVDRILVGLAGSDDMKVRQAVGRLAKPRLDASYASGFSVTAPGNQSSTSLAGHLLHCRRSLAGR
jgi:hypothetical protein